MIDDPIVAPATAGDLPALAALMAAAPLLQRYQTTRETALAALDRALQAGDLLLVSRPAGAPPEGLAWVITSRILTGAAYLRLLLVAPSAQRKGLGARLLGAAEARAGETANHLVLLVTADNVDARRFYERYGYRHVGDLRDFARPGLAEALYQKALRPHGDRIAI